jgi:UDP-N-acetyl-D-mannosaminuronic acid transferase (WecB/TagA/CpsF family)
MGFAWLYRLVHEPRRLWKRNLESLVFVWLVLREKFTGARL